MLSEFVLTVLFTVTLAFSGSTQKPPGDNATVQSSNSTDNHVLPLNNDLASFSVVNDSDKLSRREFKRNGRVMKRNGTPKKFTIPLDKKAGRTQYTGKISVGEGSYDVVFGTASFEMWLISGSGTKCDKSVQGFQHRYSPRSARDQHVGQNSLITVNVFGGYGTGPAFRDTVKVGEVSQEMKFAVLRKVVGFSENVGDGVFPMTLSSLGQFRSSSFLSKVVTEGMEPVFAFALRQNGGELHLGMIDESYVDGEIKYYDRALYSPFWQVNDAKIAVGTHLMKNARVIFIIESQFCRGPEKEVEAIYKKLGMGEKLDDGLYQIPCDKSHDLPTMMVWWSDEEQWAIPPHRQAFSLHHHFGLGILNRQNIASNRDIPWILQNVSGYSQPTPSLLRPKLA
ncbi:aspartic peptidase domain-containing protein [Amanita rubescens]|nr:aspartic peptidase domain-containing protein [Amanita rubescens]